MTTYKSLKSDLTTELADESLHRVTMQQYLGSDSRDEALITSAGPKGTLTPHVNS